MTSPQWSPVDDETTDLLAAFEQIFGAQDWDLPRMWDGAPEGPDADEIASEAEARYRQRAVDDELTERWGPQV